MPMPNDVLSEAVADVLRIADLRGTLTEHEIRLALKEYLEAFEMRCFAAGASRAMERVRELLGHTVARLGPNPYPDRLM